MSGSASNWYANIGAKYLDIVSDYAGKERFFIEGDSLLLECLSNDQFDFNPGFQLLHAIYLVE
jgi:ATP-dependent RNA helicase DDX60